VVACRGEEPTASTATAPSVPVATAPAEPTPPAGCPEAPVCAPSDDTPDAKTSTGDDSLTLVPARFEDLPGWAEDRHAEAIPAFLASCELTANLADDAPLGASPYAGKARDWRAACAAAARVAKGDHAAARRFFEQELTPWAAHGKAGPEGKLTGYYVQGLRGSRTRGGKYQTPILARPKDLVSVELTAFIPDGRDRRIWGRVEKGKLVPYPPRAELRKRPLDDKQVLLWVDDPVDAIFAEIQGSGKVLLDDGTTVWIAFAGKNGQKFRGVGGILHKAGLIQKGQGTMQGIRAWFEANPTRVDEIADQNPAKVFFELSPKAGALGTQGVVLTPRRSMAVDRAVIALSTPVWVSTRAPVSPDGKVAPWNQLLIAQDTGGGIIGPVRGDIYWGDDADAYGIAGRMGGPGKMWLLLPRALKVR
jgi:membrane-bound lytic murein transglycosylase A